MCVCVCVCVCGGGGEGRGKTREGGEEFFLQMQSIAKAGEVIDLKYRLEVWLR